jgi:hypothetical protein
MFNVQAKRWVTSNNPFYIRNISKYRPDKIVSNSAPVKVPKVPYSYSPIRNSWIGPDAVHKAAAIPFVGLKK